MTTTTIHLEYPFDDVRSGAVVLSAAMALFDAGDPVELIVSAPSGMPSNAAIEEFRRFRTELTLRYGQSPAIRVVEAATAATMSAAARLKVTGDPAQDARAVLALGSFGRRFGSAYGTQSTWLRGAPDLVRAELDASARHRQLRAPREAGSPLRVAVMIQRIQVWSAVDSIVRAGLDHPDVDLEVVLLPEETSNFQQYAHDEVEAFVAGRGAKLRDEEWLRGQIADLDVLVVPDPYITRKNTAPGLSPLEIAEAGVRLVLAPYAQALSGQAANLGMLHNQPFHNMSWRVFAPSAGAVANYVRRCAAGADHVRFVGSAKRERLLTDDAAATQARELRARLKTKSVVLWNPHFVGDRELSTFHDYAEPMLSYFADHPSIGLVVRPHPRLFTEFIVAGLQDSVDSFRRACGRLPNVVLDESMDATPAMLAADALVSDLSSLIAEYHVLGRPIALLRPSPDLALNEDRECLEGAAMIDSAAELTRFLDRVRAAQPVTVAAQEDLGAGARIIETIVREYRSELASD